jgi:hypothetical protein
MTLYFAAPFMGPVLGPIVGKSFFLEVLLLKCFYLGCFMHIYNDDGFQK